MAVEREPELPEAARAAFARVRLAAQGVHSAAPGGSRPGRGGQTRRSAAASAYSGPGADARDPQSLAATWEQVVTESGWTAQTRVARLSQMWPQIVGQANAEHATIESFDPVTGVLAIRASSTTWAESLKLMLPMLEGAIDKAVGVGVVTQVEIAGPIAPSWNHGRRRVKGRGPRDTYG
jgi:predicted nucleic acid-binding Zn ribbon protein